MNMKIGKKLLAMSVILVFVVPVFLGTIAHNNAATPPSVDFDLDKLMRKAVEEERLDAEDRKNVTYEEYVPGRVPNPNIVEYIPGEVIVAFKKSKIDVTNVQNYNGKKFKQKDETFNTAVIEVQKGAEKAFINKIKDSDDIYFAELNIVCYSDYLPPDPLFPSQWGPPEIGCISAWNSGLGKSNVVVAIVDTGIDYTHEDFSTVRLKKGYDFINNDNNAQDDCGHGTHCAGIVGATINNGKGIAGIAQCTLMGVKVLDSRGGGTAVSVSDGIKWAANNGAWIISMSLGFPVSHTALRAACIYARDIKNVLLVAASGNSGEPGLPWVYYPAHYDTVIAVGAIDKDRTRASFSSFGPELEIMAPGVDILSTMPTYHVTLNDYGFQQNYDYMDGTSMACPHVAGVAALYYSKYTVKAPLQCRLKLASSATDLDPPGKDIYTGYGLVNAAAVLR